MCRRCASITLRVSVSRCSCSSVSTRFSRSASLARLDQIRMGGDQGLAPVDERVLRGEEIDDVSAFLVGHGVSFILQGLIPRLDQVHRITDSGMYGTTQQSTSLPRQSA